MTAKEAWEAWEANYWLVQRKIIPEQGKTIVAYIKANKDKLPTVMVQRYYSSNGQLTPMLKIPPTYNTYFYWEGCFYKQLPERNPGMGMPPHVDMIVGEELQKLWQNQDFVKSLLGMDLSTGACHP